MITEKYLNETIQQVTEANKQDVVYLHNYLKLQKIDEVDVEKTIRNVRKKYKFKSLKELLEIKLSLEIRQTKLKTNLVLIKKIPVVDEPLIRTLFSAKVWSHHEITNLEVELAILKLLIKEVRRAEHLERMKAEQIGKGVLINMLASYVDKDKLQELVEELVTNFFIRSVNGESHAED